MVHVADGVPADRHEITLAEARVRLTHLVRATALTDRVTVIVDQGRPVAAVVPAAAARTLAEVTAAASQARAAAVGWARRVESVRAQLRRQHAIERAELARALTAVWRELDARCPPGADKAVDALRAAHRDLLTGPPRGDAAA
jgi:prevent-host-death family protein